MKRSSSHIRKKYDASLKQTEEAIKKQRTEIADMQAALENQQEWMKHFLVYKDREEIDRIMLTMLVKKNLCGFKEKAYHTFLVCR